MYLMHMSVHLDVRGAYLSSLLEAFHKYHPHCKFAPFLCRRWLSNLSYEQSYLGRYLIAIQYELSRIE